MNFKHRIKSLEAKLSLNNGLNFDVLISQEFQYTGKAFNSINEMIKGLNLVNLPEILKENEIWILLEKRIITLVGIVKEAIKKNFINEFQK